jgi:ATP-binding cassette subfamily B protein
MVSAVLGFEPRNDRLEAGCVVMSYLTSAVAQWQRFAIARAFARDASLLVLDEPTANLHPEAEFEIFEHFKELAHCKATLLISYRFSTLALANGIAVLSDRQIAE